MFCDRPYLKEAHLPEFFNLKGPDEAIELMCERIAPVATHNAEIETAFGRVLSETLSADNPVPTFDRSSMDGYSVRASDTYGATESLPAYLEVKGEVQMGQPPHIALLPGEAAVTHTGGMLATGADAVVMIEQTELSGNNILQVFKPVAIGENVITVGDDFPPGSTIASVGTYIDENIIGALLANGVTTCSVFRRPKLAVFSAGDELVHPSERPLDGKIRDINLYTISASARASGAVVDCYPRQPDIYEKQLSVARQALEKADVLIFTSGSSVNTRDLTSQVVGSLGDPGVLIHGLTVKPGKPTVLGMAGIKPIIGLPGNPVSALTIFNVVGKPIIRKLSGMKSLRVRPSHTAVIGEDIPSLAGRTDYVRVKLYESEEGTTAKPIFGISNSISVLSNSDGYIKVPSQVSGIYAGDQVNIFSY